MRKRGQTSGMHLGTYYKVYLFEVELDTIMPDNKKKKPRSNAASALFYIECPCHCGRALPIEYTPRANRIDINQFGNKIWTRLVSENGFEGAIEFLHENASNS